MKKIELEELLIYLVLVKIRLKLFQVYLIQCRYLHLRKMTENRINNREKNHQF